MQNVLKLFAYVAGEVAKPGANDDSESQENGEGTQVGTYHH